MGIVTQVDGCVFCCSPGCAHLPTPTPQFDSEGRQIFETKSGQFILVVEGRPGISGSRVGGVILPSGPGALPSIQIQNTLPLGNGSDTVCDTGPPSSGGGGVPAIDPPSFDTEVPMIEDAVVDFGCRFQVFSPSSACTIVDSTRDPETVSPLATTQFCDIVAATAIFPPGDNLLSARLADVEGRTGPTQQIVVRVATPTPTP
jgi:hypothetical protein